MIFYLRPISEMKETISKMQSKKKIDVTCQIITCVAEDSELAIDRAKKTLAFYVSVGQIYREFLAKNGFKNEVNNIFEEFKKSGFKNNHKEVTDSMLKSLCHCRNALRKVRNNYKTFKDAGIDLPIIQFNPIGDTDSIF